MNAWSCVPGVGLLVRIACGWVFIRNCQNVLWSDCPISHSHKQRRLHLILIWVGVVFFFAILMCVQCLVVVLIWLIRELSSHVLISTLVRCLPRSFFSHFNWVVYVLPVEFWEFFIRCECKLFVRYMICRYFPSVCSVPFILIAGSLTEHPVLIVMKVRLSAYRTWQCAADLAACETHLLLLRAFLF